MSKNKLHLIIIEEKDVSLGDFLDYWRNQFYSYSDVSDSIYWYVIDSISKGKNIKKAIALLGAWKTNAISTNPKYVNAAHRCECGKDYYYKGTWKRKTSTGFEVWTNLGDRFHEHKRMLDRPDSLIADLSNLTYRGPRSPRTKFGFVYSIAYLHFLSPMRFPIFDRFVNKAIQAIFSDSSPSKIATMGSYKEHFVKKFNHLKKASNRSERDVDKALWSYGHYLSGSRKTRHKVCCER